MMITVRANEKIMSIFSTDSRVSKTNSVDTDEDWSPSIVINRTIVSKYANKQTLIFISLFFFNHRHSYLRSDNNELNNSRHMAMKMVIMWMIRIWWYDARKNNNHGNNDNDDTNYIGDTNVFFFTTLDGCDQFLSVRSCWTYTVCYSKDTCSNVTSFTISIFWLKKKKPLRLNIKRSKQ